jgi:para-nitrobenzyl esterase
MTTARSFCARARGKFLKHAWLLVAVIAKTMNGRIRGLKVSEVKSFKGIRVSASTGGKNRFMPPTRPAPPTVVRDAVQYGHTCSM